MGVGEGAGGNLTEDSGVVVGFPGLGLPGVGQDPVVLVSVTVLYFNSVFVLITVTYEITGEECSRPLWLSWAKATAARKRVNKVA